MSHKIRISPKKNMLGPLVGHYTSSVRGRGMEFFALREYAAGDDVRDIDWKASARSSDLYIKTFHEERELQTLFFLDNGASMSFRSGTFAKRDLQNHLFSILSSVIIENNDRLGGALFSETIGSFSMPAKGSSAFSFVQKLQNTPNDITGFGQVESIFRFLIQRRIKNHIIFIFSDSFPVIAQQDIAPVILYNSIFFIGVHDPIEYGHTTDFRGTCSFGDRIVDINTGVLSTDIVDMLVQTRKKEDDYLSSHGIPHVRIHTDVAAEMSLAQLFLSQR